MPRIAGLIGVTAPFAASHPMWERTEGEAGESFLTADRRRKIAEENA